MQKEKDIQIVNLMIGIYCRKKHKQKKCLCQECSQLVQYAQARREHCPFGDQKTFCFNCKIHCYKPDMRQKIAEVMRFSGPRIMFYHPVIAFSHLAETVKYKRKSEKQQPKQEGE